MALAQLKLQERIGVLVVADELRRSRRETAFKVANALTQLPAKLAPVVAPQDPQRAETLLAEEIDRVLNELAGDLDQSAAADDAERTLDRAAKLRRRAAPAPRAPAHRQRVWAHHYRILSKASAAGPGRWSTERTPYLREIMDCLSPSSPVHEVVLQAGTQLGKTEAGLNWVGHTIDQGQGPMMIVFPTSNASKKASKTRVGPMIADTPRLRGKVRDAKSRDSHNTTLLKEFDGGVLIFAGANSATELKSSPVGKIFCDELEEWPRDVETVGPDIVIITSLKLLRMFKKAIQQGRRETGDRERC